jgi:hypothetical protein
MKNALLALVVLLLPLCRASADFIVDDDFDSYDGQAEFEAAWTPIGTSAPASAELAVDVHWVSPQQSVRIPGTGDDGRYRNQLTFDPTPLLGIGDQLIWSFDYYDTLPIGRPQPNYATLQTTANPAGALAGEILAMGLNDNQFQGEEYSGGNYFMAGISGYSHDAVDPDGGPDEHEAGTGPGAFFKLNDTETGSRGEDEAWHNLKLVITTTDGATVNHEYYVDGVLAETVSNVGPNLQYSVIRIGSGLANGNRQAFFDNMQLQFIQAVAVPEVSSFAVVGLAGVLAGGAACVRRWRRAA